MNKSGIIGLCMLSSSLSGFAVGYFSNTLYSLIPKSAVEIEAKPNRLLNGVVGGLCALVGGTSTVVILNRRYGYMFEESQYTYQ
jgi:hypothetical protein